MKRVVLWALMALNLVLLGCFLSRVANENSAMAQQNPPAERRPGDYLMIPGEVTGGSSDVVYIFDSVNGELSAMIYDDSKKRLEAMPKINVARDFQNAARIPDQRRY